MAVHKIIGMTMHIRPLFMSVNVALISSDGVVYFYTSDSASSNASSFLRFNSLVSLRHKKQKLPATAQIANMMNKFYCSPFYSSTTPAVTLPII